MKPDIAYLPEVAMVYLSSGSWDDAARTFDMLLREKPTNLVALMGKVSTHLQ